jgi:hypothetical protein
MDQSSPPEDPGVADLPPDCNGNSVPDPCDLECGGPCDLPGCGQKEDCNDNGIPDDCESPTDCQPNGRLDSCDIAMAASRDCQKDGIPDECQLLSNDCNNNGIPDDCDILTGLDCNRNGIPDGCEPEPDTDTDTDGVSDSCDNCPAGPNPRQEDCDNDGVGDICAISNCPKGDPVCSDCNSNRIPDGCDVSGPITGWGNNFDGELDVPTPNRDFVAVAAGGGHGLGLKFDGSIVAWGRNLEGQCNVPSPNTGFVAIAAGGSSSFGLKADGSIVKFPNNDVPAPNTGFVAIAAGAGHSLGLKSNGSVVAWGNNGFGQCDVPTPNTGFVAIAAGWDHSLGLKADTSIVAWGCNYFGLCNVPSPNNGFVEIAAGELHSLGLKADGSIVEWGQIHITGPTLPSPIPNAGYVAISSTLGHILSLKADGSIVAWGSNSYGECDVPSPNIGFFKIAAGAGRFSLAIRAESDCNKNGIPDGCESDGDSDGFIDACDNCPSTANPNQLDCNIDNVGDVCTIANCVGDPACADCNGNSIPDSCDISLGATDCQPDGIPDVCQINGNVVILWNATAGLWKVPSNWCPTLIPDNGGGNSYDTTISGPPSLITLNISPTLSNLTINNGAAVIVNDASEANVRTLSVDNPITNQGIFRATDRERLILDAPAINQAGGGRLQALGGVQGPGETGLKSILEVNGSIVTGGFAETDADGEIHLIGGAELDGVTVSGVVVPDGQYGQFNGVITNNGQLRVAGATLTTRLEPTTSNAVLAGAGSVRLTSQSKAQVGNFTTGFTNGASHKIEGAGVIYGEFANDGMVEADVAGQHLIISSPGDKENDGTMQAIGGGVLRIASSIDGSGDLIARGGTILIQPAVTVAVDDIDVPPGSVSHLDIGVSPAGPATVNAATLNITGGIVTINNGSTVNISGIVTICPAVSPPGSVAELHVNQSILNTVNLDVCAGGVLTVASTISLSGSFNNAMTNGSSTPAPAHWSWAPGSDLIFTGGQAASALPNVLDGWAIFEVASTNSGPTGGANDYKLADVILASGSHVSLVNQSQNHAPPVVAEAVYCETLTLNGGAVLNLNGLAFYAGGILVTPGPYGGGLIADEPRG